MAEAGTHRIQRVPDNERRGRVHSSTVTVAVLTAVPQSARVKLDVNEVNIEWYSGSGAGGQHRNKHPNSARITHLATGLVRTAQTRSRANSQQLAMAALEEALTAMGAHQVAYDRQQARTDQVGGAERADRDRIWAFQRDRVEDLRTGKAIRLKEGLAGQLDRLW